jgi:hypothetical protein
MPCVIFKFIVCVRLRSVLEYGVWPETFYHDVGTPGEWVSTAGRNCLKMDEEYWPAVAWDNLPMTNKKPKLKKGTLLTR